MIKYNSILYEFDPVQSIFHKSECQKNIETSNQFPDRLRLERRRIEYLNCDTVLTEFTGFRWNLITGLHNVKRYPGYVVGNRVLNPNSSIKGYRNFIREMLVIHNNGITGYLNLYHFPNYDPKTAIQRMRAAIDFISFLDIKKGQP